MKRWILVVIIALVVIAGIFLIRTNPSSNSVEVNPGSNIQGNVVENGNSNAISLQQLSQHDKEGDCWIAYNGKVYDITSWLPRHPGTAAAIAPYCGTEEEFTAAFTRKHGTSKASLLMQVGTFMGDFEIVGST